MKLEGENVFFPVEHGIVVAVRVIEKQNQLMPTSLDFLDLDYRLLKQVLEREHLENLLVRFGTFEESLHARFSLL